MINKVVVPGFGRIKVALLTFQRGGKIKTDHACIVIILRIKIVERSVISVVVLKGVDFRIPYVHHDGVPAEIAGLSNYCKSNRRQQNDCTNECNDFYQRRPERIRIFGLGVFSHNDTSFSLDYRLYLAL